MTDCLTCEYRGRPTYDYPCGVCVDGMMYREAEKPPTNADHIRAMSDEELAEWLNRKEINARYFGLTGKDGWLDWLQSPAEGGGGE